MKKSLVMLLAAGLAMAPAFAADPMPASKADAMSGMKHPLMNAADLKWGPAPAALPAGVQMVVLAGNPDAAGPFTVRMKPPAGYKIPLHTHPTDELVTVIEGGITLSMDAAGAGQALSPGGFANLPAGMKHQASFPSGGTVQVHGMGPFSITYVNPKDDPRAMMKK
jgi:quercetin dioxygenase-like cupin family protein